MRIFRILLVLENIIRWPLCSTRTCARVYSYIRYTIVVLCAVQNSDNIRVRTTDTVYRRAYGIIGDFCFYCFSDWPTFDNDAIMLCKLNRSAESGPRASMKILSERIRTKTWTARYALKTRWRTPSLHRSIRLKTKYINRRAIGRTKELYIAEATTISYVHVYVCFSCIIEIRYLSQWHELIVLKSFRVSYLYIYIYVYA